MSDGSGTYRLFGLPSGQMTVTGQLSGFKTAQRSLVFDQRPRQVDLQMAVGALTETVTVTADAPLVDTQSSEVSNTVTRDAVMRRAEHERMVQQAVPSANVQSLQRRAAGVLPVRID